MKIFGLGNGEQNHDLRKRKPILLSEEEMSSRYAVSKDKNGLKAIADQLNAVNKNKTLEKAFESHKDQKNEHKYKELFENESWEYSSSLARTKNYSSQKICNKE